MNAFLKSKNDVVRTDHSEAMKRDMSDFKSDGEDFKTALASTANSDGFTTAVNSTLNSAQNSDASLEMDEKEDNVQILPKELEGEEGAGGDDEIEMF